MDSSSPLTNKPISTVSLTTQNIWIDRLQLGFAMSQFGLNPDQNDIFFKCLFNAFFGVGKRLATRDGDAVIDLNKNIRSKSTFFNYWQKQSVAAVECIDLETFLAGMAILEKGTDEERSICKFYSIRLTQ
jgi:hypothetical protein